MLNTCFVFKRVCVHAMVADCLHTLDKIESFHESLKFTLLNNVKRMRMFDEQPFILNDNGKS